MQNLPHPDLLFLLSRFAAVDNIGYVWILTLFWLALVIVLVLVSQYSIVNLSKAYYLKVLTLIISRLHTFHESMLKGNDALKEVGPRPPLNFVWSSVINAAVKRLRIYERCND